MSDLFQIPIINYHKISETGDIGITTRRPVDFRSDLLWLQENGFSTVTFQTLDSGTTLPEKPVIITFDDGYKSVLEQAVPALAEFGFSVVIYCPAAYIGKNNDWDVQFGGMIFEHLSADELLLLISAGHEIGSHGLTHRLLRHLSPGQRQKEISLSKVLLEEIIGREVCSFSYPFGRADHTSVEMVREAGYKFAVSGLFFKSGKVTAFNLPRTNIYRMDSLSVFAEKLTRPLPVNALLLRDYCIQKGGLATAWYQKLKGAIIP